MTYRTDDAERAGCGHLTTPHQEFDILGTVPVGVMVLRADATPIYANRAAQALFGTEGESLSLVDLLNPIDGKELHEHLYGDSHFEAIAAGPQHRQVMVNVAERRAGASADFVVSMTDITPLKQATERAEFLAHHDPLTRLGNRTLLQSVWDVMEDRLVSSELEVHALAIDLDHFKEVNDVHGHGMGDLVLRHAAHRLQSTVGNAGHVFRFGGDEFFVLIDNEPRSAAVEISRRIVTEMCRPMTVLGHEVEIGCSVGIASAPLDGTSRDALHRAADLALYDVKRTGRGNVACFDPLQEQVVLDRRLLQTDLVLAIAGDGLNLSFLPQFDNRTSRLESLEAVVSWNNARTGRVIEPDEFLGLAEEAGLLHLIDLWTVRTAIARFAQLCDDGLDCPRLSVTIGAPSLIREDTACIVAHHLAEHGVDAERLEVQITEMSVLRAESGLAEAMQRMRAIGARIVLDGFCATRPALSYLRSLGVERVRLHRHVANRMLGDADAEALIGTIWTLCQRLGIEMSADGVETAEQWDALRQLGRIRAQGGFFDTLDRVASGRQRADEASG